MKSKISIINFILIILCGITILEVNANESFVFTKGDKIINKFSEILIYKDSTKKLKASDVAELSDKEFNSTPNGIPNLGVTKYNFWIKFSITNSSDFKDLILGINNPLIDTIELYEFLPKPLLIEIQGDKINYYERKYDNQNFLFDIEIFPYQTKTYLLKVNSWEQLMLPIYIGEKQAIYEANSKNDLIFGIFFGLMFFLVLYNLFIYFSTKDISYIYYVCYACFITLTQAALNGYTFRFLFPSSPLISNATLVIFNSIAGLATILFIQNFLNLKFYFPKLRIGYYLISLLYLGGIFSILFGLYQISYNLMDIGGLLIAPFSLFIAIRIALKGNRSAKIFLLAWSFFLIGVILFVLKNASILPSNNFTNYTMTIGIAIEGILISFALADRINIMRKEKDEYQQQAIQALKENQFLIKEQNIILEQKVKERTAELNKAIEDLKQAQSQLVESEKMASLGQLTAGIAHEINNPINFVSSNVFPLKQDIEDLKSILNKYAEITESADLKSKLNEINNLKEELDYEILLEELDTIIHGIEDGAKRTAEIVSGLRNFSRLDESEFQSANVNDCINTTLKIINPKLSDIEIITELGDIPPIDCYPGKLNQFFLNTIDNAIYAVNAIKTPNHKGKIEIKTTLKNDHVLVSLKDNGIGMNETTKNKIFDPFFTTKDVGEGTGLGMSIAHGILEMHHAKIEIESEINKGTEIKIFLPLTLPTWKE